MLENEPDKHLKPADIPVMMHRVAGTVVAYYDIMEKDKLAEIDAGQLRNLLESCGIISDFVGRIADQATAMLAQQTPQSKH
jgi:hypothetical protein